MLEGAGDRLLVDREHEHLVVGEQVPLDRLAEAEAVELGAERSSSSIEARTASCSPALALEESS